MEDERSGVRSGDKREFSRSAASVWVKATTDCGVVIEGRSRDVSLNGVSVACDRALPLATPCAVTLTLEAGAETVHIEARGKASRIDGGMVAIEFDEVDGDGFAHLRNLVLYNAQDVDRTEEEFERHLGLRRPVNA